MSGVVLLLVLLVAALILVLGWGFRGVGHAAGGQRAPAEDQDRGTR
jgi:hypothetical protein